MWKLSLVNPPPLAEVCAVGAPQNDGSWGGRLQTSREGTQYVRSSCRDGAVGQGAKAESESDWPARLTDAVVAGCACIVFC